MANEMKGFVFAVTFIVIFATLLSTIPVGFQGQGATGTLVTPVNPSLLSDFSATEDWTKADLNAYGQYIYAAFGGRDWVFSYYVGTMQLGAKVLIGGILWLGQLDSCVWTSSNGTDRGSVLSITEIGTDAVDGVAQYTMTSLGSGNSLGGFIVYWNTTTYSNPSDAWTAEKLYLLHGIGIGASATSNIGSLIVNLLLLQLPDVPLLVNVLLITPIWACVIFVLWFIIKEMIPFL